MRFPYLRFSEKEHMKKNYETAVNEERLKEIQPTFSPSLPSKVSFFSHDFSTLFAGFKKKPYLCVNMDNKDGKCTSRIS